MIVARIFGGLGNQMFQYAAGRSSADRHQAVLKLDLSWFEKPDRTSGWQYGLDKFGIVATRASSSEVDTLRYGQLRVLRKALPASRRFAATCVREPHFHYWSGFEQILPPAILDGYWQSPQYFSGYEAQIRTAFAFPPLPSARSSEVADRIRRSTNSVSVHVRRGDYVSNRKFNAIHGTCPANCYQDALQLIRREICSVRFLSLSMQSTVLELRTSQLSKAQAELMLSLWLSVLFGMLASQ